MTKKEAVVIEAYTGVCMLTGNDRNFFYKYINHLMGRLVYTHELPALRNEIKEKAKPDFIKICKNVGKKTKTREFKAMTKAEFCEKWQLEHQLRCGGTFGICPLFFEENCEYSNKPCKVNGKYILIEVKE